MKPKGQAVQRPLMPRPAVGSLPTPASSTDIQAKSSTNTIQFDILPPAALKTANLRGSSTSSAATNASDSSYRPLSPTSPVAAAKGASASRKRAHSSTTMTKEKDDYKLPPPPTRSRRIIQMNPPIQESQSFTMAQSTASASAKAPAAAGETVTKAGLKRKQGGSTTAASKKSARKTAHSLIERRRRSKMNEEFGVLKNMIPACHGQEMHKLAILQASIEYTRYLEKCIADLTSSRSRGDTPVPSPPKDLPSNMDGQDSGGEDEEEDNEDMDAEEDETMSDAVSPNMASKYRTTFQFAHTSSADYRSDSRSIYSTTTSPNIGPLDMRHYSETVSPAIPPSDARHYSFASSVHSTRTTPSVHASPAFVPQSQPQPCPPSSQWSPASAARSGGSAAPGPTNFMLSSPALRPQADREDHEATEALLMLNADRRGSKGASGMRGMSVKDLLS